MFQRTGSIVVGATVLAALVSGTAVADTPGPPVTPVSTTVLVAGGSGTQTDPHISGSLVTYTDRQGATDVRIHYQDLTGATDVAIPVGAGEIDQLSDVSGSTVVFQRTYITTGIRSIMAFDTAAPGAGPVELAPDAAVRRTSPSIGGRTVSWVQAAGPSSVQTDIYAYDLGTGAAAATAVTSDGATSNNRDPAVSADGSVIAWSKCNSAGVSCDIWRSITGSDGTWGAPVQLTASSGEELLPDTNGQVVVYASYESGERDIEWLDVAGTNPHTLVMPGNETNPNMSGSLVSFEHTDIGASNADLFAYDLASGTLYRLTDTPALNETLNDISVSADGTVRVVFVEADSLGTADVFALTFHIASGPAYKICPLFDQAKSHRLGSVVPIRLRLCDADGANLSSASLTLTATGLVKKDPSASTAVVEDAGNANPDSAFRYDETLAGYVYNLSTRGLSRGTWELRFTVSGDPTTYGITFDLR